MCRTLSLLLLSGSSLAGGVTAGSGSTGSGGSAATGADVQEQVLDILALESLKTYQKPIPYLRSVANAHLGEKSCPDGLNLLDLCGLDQGLELVGLGELAPAFSSPTRSAYSDVDTVIGEDEGCVGGGELGGRHCDA